MAPNNITLNYVQPLLSVVKFSIGLEVQGSTPSSVVEFLINADLYMICKLVVYIFCLYFDFRWRPFTCQESPASYVRVLICDRKDYYYYYYYYYTYSIVKLKQKVLRCGCTNCGRIRRYNIYTLICG